LHNKLLKKHQIKIKENTCLIIFKLLNNLKVPTWFQNKLLIVPIRVSDIQYEDNSICCGNITYHYYAKIDIGKLGKVKTGRYFKT